MPPAGSEPAKSSRAVPATHRLGHEPIAASNPMRSIGASRRPCVFRDERDVDGMRQGIPRGYTARQPSATARSVPAVSSRTERGRAGNGRYGDSVPAEPRRSGRFR